MKELYLKSNEGNNSIKVIKIHSSEKKMIILMKSYCYNENFLLLWKSFIMIEIHHFDLW